MTSPWPEEVFHLVRKGIALANASYSEMIPQPYKELVARRMSELNASELYIERGNLNVIIFHIKIPEDYAKVVAPDIQDIDHGKINYEEIINLNIKLALKTNPSCRVLLLTDSDFMINRTKNSRIGICRLNVKANEPMYERVLTMLAYTRSRLFDEPTVFLDSDAFLLRPVHNIFANNFDVALTHRNIYGQMPINEGVIFANIKNTNNVIKFFETYLASYLSIEQNEEIAEIYSNLRRWRGGQLSINAAANRGQVYQTGQEILSNIRLCFLPCSKYNLSQINDHEINENLPSRSAILHLKGPRKSWLSRLEALMR